MRPYNWETCRKDVIFGLRKGVTHFSPKPGDLFLVRLTGKENGVHGIWSFKKERAVESVADVPWTDAEYAYIFYFDPLVLEFGKRFDEEFYGVSKYSEKAKLNSMRIIGSLVRLNGAEAKNYLGAIVVEKASELNAEVAYLGDKVNLLRLLKDTIERLAKERDERHLHRRKLTGKADVEDMVGDPLNFRGIVYAPRNEAGVILLFSKVMDDLGILYESTPSVGFPDMIGRIRTEKGLEKYYVEFEYKSSNFRSHRHDPEKCDLIVCWENDWPNCPVKVIELKTVVEELTPSASPPAD